MSDLMLNAKQFDLANMTDVERANLKYLVMSTDELKELLKKKSKSIYYKPREYKLRYLMSYDDFYQICAYKLLLNDGILRFNANYKLDPAIYCWFLRTAMWQSYDRPTRINELCILDRPCNDDNDTTIGDLILKDDCFASCEGKFDGENRIKTILSRMDKTPSRRIVLKANETSVPFSEYNLAKLYLTYHLGKKELSKIMYNSDNKKLVSNQIFNKFYKNMIIHISSILNEELNSVGEVFTINEEEL